MQIHGLLRPALAFAGAAILAACSVPGGLLTARDTLVETRALDVDGRFSLKNVNGRLTVTTWPKAEVRIEAERAAVSERALERLRVEIEGEGREVTVKTRHERTGVFPFMGGGGKVDFRVTLPVGARVRVSTVNGPVNVEGLAGELHVRAVNGGLEIRDASGTVDAGTVNGGIDARYAAVPHGGRHRFETVNGAIELSLPEGAAGRLEAKTVNGSIRCDLPVTDSRKSRRRLQGRLGPGDGGFEMETVNGSISVRRGGARPPAEAS